MVRREIRQQRLPFCFCAIENVWYTFCHGVLEWYDTNTRMWKKMKGLVGLPKFSRDAYVDLVDYGGKLVVFWDTYLPSSDCTKRMIWCEEIALERRKSCEIRGKVERFDHVFTVPEAYNLVKVVDATV